MKHARMFFPLVLAIGLAACGISSKSDYDAEARAEYHLRVADSLEAASALREATREYELVTKLYANTSSYPLAARNTALLYINPANPLSDDSLALHWFQTYLQFPVARDERVKADIYVTMLKRVTALRREVNRRGAVIDSLQTVARKQAGELAGKTKRLADLEAELKKASSELDKLREVDVRINKRKVGK